MAKKLALFEGSWQKVLIKVILLLLVLFVVYSLFNKIKWRPTKSEEAINDYIQNELPNTTPIDNSTNADPDTISNSEAELIANNLEVYMDQWGTNEESMFSALQCLNGASLNKVFSSFGAREYDGTMMDLFGWYSEELSNTLFTSIFYNECVPNCDGYWDNCHALTYMREIWTKSSIPITF
jgi:hypothetical protein